MKTPLSIIEQDSLRTKGVLNQSEIAYREGELFFAEDAITGTKRVINVSTVVKEAKDLLLG